MGHTRHHALIVTGNEDDVEAAREYAVQRARYRSVTSWSVSRVYSGASNGFCTFVIFPDGLNELGEDEPVDGVRSDVVKFLTGMNLAHGHNAVAWAEVQYGDDEGENRLVSSDAELVHP